MDEAIIPQTDPTSESGGKARHNDLIPARTQYKYLPHLSLLEHNHQSQEHPMNHQTFTKTMTDNLAAEQAANLPRRGRASSGERDNRLRVRSLSPPLPFSPPSPT